MLQVIGCWPIGHVVWFRLVGFARVSSHTNATYFLCTECDTCAKTPPETNEVFQCLPPSLPPSHPLQEAGLQDSWLDAWKSQTSCLFILPTPHTHTHRSVFSKGNHTAIMCLFYRPFAITLPLPHMCVIPRQFNNQELDIVSMSYYRVMTGAL